MVFGKRKKAKIQEETKVINASPEEGKDKIPSVPVEDSEEVKELKSLFDYYKKSYDGVFTANDLQSFPLNAPLALSLNLQFAMFCELVKLNNQISEMRDEDDNS